MEMLGENEEDMDRTIITFNQRSSYKIVLNRRLSLAVAIVSRAVLPTLVNIYSSFLRNQQVLLDNICNQLLPSILAFLVNTVSNSLSSVQRGITYPAQKQSDRVQQHLSIDNINTDSTPEKSVDLIILSEPKGEIEADVIFIHGLHGGLGRTWTQGQWRHENHKLKDQSPTIEPTGEMHVPPRRTSLKRTFSDIYARSPKKTMKLHNGSCVKSPGEWEIVECEDIEVNECFTDCWPRDWIPLDCPTVRVIALNYSTDVLWCPVWLEKRKRTGMVERSDEMIEELIKVGVGRKPIIWVGHSKGGLYIKQIILNAIERNFNNLKEISDIQRQTKAIMFYSVPHKGSILADMSLPFLRRSIELLEVQRNCDFVLDLDRKFVNLCKQGSFSPEIFSFIETSFTLMSFLFLKIVAFDSADLGIGTKCGVPLDHREICKPAGRDCFLYLELIKLIKRVLNNNSK